MVAMCHFSLLLSLLPPLHAIETGQVDIVLATNRPLAAAATLNSVCSNTHDITQLVFHVVVPDDDEVSLSSETRLACSGASFVDWTLSKVESTVVEIRGRLPLWNDPRLMSVNQEKIFPFSVPVADNQLDPKHKSPFNLARFYMPEILRARGVETALLLDDDVIVQEDLSKLWPRAAVAPGKALAASCKHWRLKKSRNGEEEPVVESHVSYLDVPYFGFGSINRWRTLEEATCHTWGDVECVPPGLLRFMGEAEAFVNASWMIPRSVRPAAWWALRHLRAWIGSDARAIATAKEGEEEEPFEAALHRSRAFNFGFVVVNTTAWAEQQLTDKYETWVEINAQDHIFPSDSLAFGLGLPFLALRGSVQCFEDQQHSLSAIRFEQGFGFVPWEAMESAAFGLQELESATALHFNGNTKPWDAERCFALAKAQPLLPPPDQRFVSYAKLSRQLYEAHLANPVEESGCARRLYGHSSVDGTGFATYDEAYVWATSQYRVGKRPTATISDCVSVCDELFEEEGVGTLACPKSALELELLKDIFWKPKRTGWIGVYRVDTCSGVNMSTADAATLEACSSWNQCSTGFTSFTIFNRKDNAGVDCAVDEKCAMLPASPKYNKQGRMGATLTAYSDAYFDRACGSGLKDYREFSNRKGKGDRYFSEASVDSAFCVCEASPPHPNFTAALPSLVAQSPGSNLLCNPLVHIKNRCFEDDSYGFLVFLACFFAGLILCTYGLLMRCRCCGDECRNLKADFQSCGDACFSMLENVARYIFFRCPSAATPGVITAFIMLQTSLFLMIAFSLMADAFSGNVCGRKRHGTLVASYVFFGIGLVYSSWVSWKLRHGCSPQEETPPLRPHDYVQKSVQICGARSSATNGIYDPEPLTSNNHPLFKKSGPAPHLFLRYTSDDKWVVSGKAALESDYTALFDDRDQLVLCSSTKGANSPLQVDFWEEPWGQINQNLSCTQVSADCMPQTRTPVGGSIEMGEIVLTAAVVGVDDEGPVVASVIEDYDKGAMGEAVTSNVLLVSDKSQKSEATDPSPDISGTTQYSLFQYSPFQYSLF